MSDYRWYYGYGREPERYYGGFATRGEAVEEGLTEAANLEYRELTIVEGCHGEISTTIFDASELMEQLCEHNDELTDEDGGLDLDKRTAAQEQVLEDRLATILKTWLTENNLGRAWSFSHMRNEVVIIVPSETPT